MCDVLHQYIKTKDKILHIGCGQYRVRSDQWSMTKTIGY